MKNQKKNWKMISSYLSLTGLENNDNVRPWSGSTNNLLIYKMLNLNIEYQ